MAKNFRPPRRSRQPKIDLKLTYLDGVAEYLKAHERKTKVVLFKLGAYVRTTMRNSMKKKPFGGKPSSPNKPPKYLKTGAPNVRDGISFTVEAKRKTVVIGPDQFDRRRKSDRGAKQRRAGQTIPQILNEGGDVLIPRLVGTQLVHDVATIKPRPFVSPAHEKGMEKFLELLQTEKLRIKGRG